jgi:ribosome-associated translation inhibitor RaiA
MKTLIEFHGVERSEAVEQNALAKAEKLARHFDRINTCRVTIEAPHRHQHKGEHYRVRFDVTAPGMEIVAGREPTRAADHQDVYVALRDAYHAARRQLEDAVRRRRDRFVEPRTNPGRAP